MKVQFVIPAFNESANLSEVIPELFATLAGLEGEYFVLVVDDGSSDDTWETLKRLQKHHSNLGHFPVSRNRGKAHALREGFVASIDNGAEIIFMMDADGQDNPNAIPAMLAELHGGADLVTAARKKRRDRLVKRVTSRLYNAVTRLISGAAGSDFNSGLKAMKAPVAEELVPLLYGELHRYITVLAFWFGFNTSEVVVNHRARLNGKSKYGVSRFWRGFLDLVTVRFIIAYEARPFHIFGGLGFLLTGLGTATFIYLTVIWLTGEAIGNRPLLIAGLLFFTSGLQTLFFGLLAELVVYFRFQRSTSAQNEER